MITEHVLPVSLVMLMEVAVEKLVHVVRLLHGHETVVQVGAVSTKLWVDEPHKRHLPEAGERVFGTLGSETLEAGIVGHIEGDGPRQEHLGAELSRAGEERRVVHEALVVKHREHIVSSRLLQRRSGTAHVVARQVRLVRQVRRRRPELVVPLELRPVLRHAGAVHAAASDLVAADVHLVHGAVVRAGADDEHRDRYRALCVRVEDLVREDLDEVFADLREWMFGVWCLVCGGAEAWVGVVVCVCVCVRACLRL